MPAAGAGPTSAGPPPGDAPPEPRQRWRIVFRRTAAAASLPHREAVEAIEDRLLGSPLPVLREARRGGRPRLAFGAPLPLGMIVDRELLDAWLLVRWPIGDVRAALSTALPPGYELADLYDVWLGAPALPASVSGAEYSVILADPIDVPALRQGVSRLLATDRLPRERAKGCGTVSYDLRPLLAGLEVGPSGELRIQVRFDPVRGSGRPEEVVAALAEVTGHSLGIAETRRARLIVEGT